MLQILQKKGFQPLSSLCVKHGGIDLKIQLKASNVHICSPVTAYQSVDHHAFCVEKSIFIGIAASPCFQKILYIGIGRPIHKGMVWFTWDHQTHIQPRFRRNLKGRQDCIVWHKVWGLDIDMMSGLVKKLKIVVADLTVTGVWAAVNNLDSYSLAKQLCLKRLCISLKLICNFPVVRDGILHMHFEMPDMRYYSFFCKKSYKPYFYWRKNS